MSDVKPPTIRQLVRDLLAETRSGMTSLELATAVGLARGRRVSLESICSAISGFNNLSEIEHIDHDGNTRRPRYFLHAVTEPKSSASAISAAVAMQGPTAEAHGSLTSMLCGDPVPSRSALFAKTGRLSA